MGRSSGVEVTKIATRTTSIKNEFIFYLRISFKSFTSFITVKTIRKLNLGHRDKLEIKMYKISRSDLGFPH